MTKKDKDLLLKDLSARLPYGVVLDVDTTDWKAPQGHIQVKIEGVGLIFKDQSLIVNGSYYGDNYKPYLRPLSSMTEEEKREIYDWLVENDVDWFDFSKLRLDEILISFDSSWLLVNWLNSHHFDYRGLIEKGLALEAPDDMYRKGKQQ